MPRKIKKELKKIEYFQRTSFGSSISIFDVKFEHDISYNKYTKKLINFLRRKEQISEKVSERLLDKMNMFFLKQSPEDFEKDFNNGCCPEFGVVNCRNEREVLKTMLGSPAPIEMNFIDKQSLLKTPNVVCIGSLPHLFLNRFRGKYSKKNIDNEASK